MEFREVKEGKIYKLKRGTRLYEEDMFNRRPVIVIKKKRNCAMVVSVDMMPKDADYDYRIAIEYLDIKKGKLLSTVYCDIVKDIEYKYIENEIGYIDEKTIENIEQKILEKQNRDFQEKFIATESEKEKIIRNLMIELSKAKISMNEIVESANKTKAMLEESRKPINIWKERGVSAVIGFVTGFLSGMLVSFVTQNDFSQKVGKAVDFSFGFMNLLIENLFYN